MIVIVLLIYVCYNIICDNYFILLQHYHPKGIILDMMYLILKSIKFLKLLGAFNLIKEFDFGKKGKI